MFFLDKVIRVLESTNFPNAFIIGLSDSKIVEEIVEPSVEELLFEFEFGERAKDKSFDIDEHMTKRQTIIDQHEFLVDVFRFFIGEDAVEKLDEYSLQEHVIHHGLYLFS